MVNTSDFQSKTCRHNLAKHEASMKRNDGLTFFTICKSLLCYKRFGCCIPVRLFSNFNQIFFGYFDPENIFLDDKSKYVSG